MTKKCGTKKLSKGCVIPCSDCPYRRDAPLAYWHADHFTKLLRDNADELNGSVYSCHKDADKPSSDRLLCRGWLLDQKRRNFPSIQLRLRIMSSPDVRLVELLNRVHSGGHELYPSLEAMAEANLRVLERGVER